MSEEMLNQAAAWFAVLQDEHVSEADYQQWQAWLAADPAHARLWHRVEAISQPFRQLVASVPVNATRATLDQAHTAGRRRALRLLAGGSVMVGTGLLLQKLLPWQVWQYEYAVAHAAYRTRVGERQQFRLPDGTLLALNTASAVDVDYGEQWRRIVLHQGEILVESAHDRQARPLVVDTPMARILALGTRFTVRSDLHAGHVAVFSGAVRVTPEHGAAVEVAAGQQVKFTAASVVADGSAELAREAWSHGKIIADDIALGDFIHELARYTTVKVHASPEVARLRLVGVYSIAHPARDVPLILAALENALPVRVQANSPTGLVIIPR